MEIISQLGLDSFGGVVSFFLTVATLALPILIRYNKKRKKELKKAAGGTTNYTLVTNHKTWQSMPAKIVKFVFTKDKIAVTKDMVKYLAMYGDSPLVAVVEFKNAAGEVKQGQVFVGEVGYNENDIIHIKQSLDGLLILDD